ncbi:MAG: hypothetical protein MUC36_23605 [Planctomycetes bacterium]|jgi:hypothetical protein|nr:hypothetical protein [Planctomycetota bacterium]
MVLWTAAVEGDADVAVVAAILESRGQQLGPVHVCGGKSRLDARLRGYVAAAARAPWIILRDLDRDAPCAPEWLAREPGRWRVGWVRLAVRAVEAWLLADRDAAASWLSVPVGKLPRQVEVLPDPKLVLQNLAAASRSATIRRDVVPRGSARIGPGYVDQVREYCAGRWRPDVAAGGSDSLRRLLHRLDGRNA